MINQGIENIISVLELMRELELKIASLYNECKRAFPSFGVNFWGNISSEEIKHAEYISRLIEIILKKPDLFTGGISFNAVAIKTVSKGIEEDIDKIKKGEISGKNMLFIARDIENSIIEARYKEIVKTSDVEFMSLVEEITSQTIQHRKYLSEKIAQLEE